VVKTYLDYGNNYSTNVFVHDFFLKKYKRVRTSHNETNLRFFKRYSYSNDILGIEHSFLLRRENDEYFNFRIWAVSYNNWLVLAISWFKPSKPLSNSTGRAAAVINLPIHDAKSVMKRKLPTPRKACTLQNYLRYSL
jgi:hypothetical protein